MKFRLLLASLSLSFPLLVCAQGSGTFSDVPAAHPFAMEIRFVSERGIMLGTDGSFSPDQQMNRATALMILARLHPEWKAPVSASGSVFEDVEAGAWYENAIAVSLAQRIIDGPPAKTKAEPGRVVTREEFLKMLLLSSGLNPIEFLPSYSMPLARDMRSDNWSFPYYRIALAQGIVHVSGRGLLEPTIPLTRGDVASLLYRFDRATKKNHKLELLRQSENDITASLKLIEKKRFTDTELAASRLLILAQGVNGIDPESEEAKGLTATAEALNAIVQAIRAAKESQTEALNGAMATVQTRVSELEDLPSPFPELAKRLNTIRDALSKQTGVR